MTRSPNGASPAERSVLPRDAIESPSPIEGEREAIARIIDSEAFDIDPEIFATRRYGSSKPSAVELAVNVLNRRKGDSLAKADLILSRRVDGGGLASKSDLVERLKRVAGQTWPETDEAPHLLREASDHIITLEGERDEALAIWPEWAVAIREKLLQYGADLDDDDGTCDLAEAFDEWCDGYADECERGAITAETRLSRMVEALTEIAADVQNDEQIGRHQGPAHLWAWAQARARSALAPGSNEPATPAQHSAGWVLVPREPTEAMLKAAFAAMNATPSGLWKAMKASKETPRRIFDVKMAPRYRAMIAAAPANPDRALR